MYYSVIWKKSASLKPKDVMGERPYTDYFYERAEDAILKKQIESRNNVLVIGPPLAGKTRAVYQQFIRMKKKADILIPRNIGMPSFVFPSPRKFWRDRVIFIDDLQYFIEKQENYHLLFRKAKEKKISIVATCHTGLQYKKVKNKLLEQNLELETLFDKKIIEYDKITSETAQEITSKININWNNVKFNGTVGSLFMKLSEMERRFDNSSNIEKTILNSIRMMYITGLWNNNVFSLEWIKLVTKRYELAGKDFEWSGWLKSLEDKEFIKIVRRNQIWADDAYLQYVVKPHIDIPDIEIFDEMIDMFSTEPDALNIIGEKAYNIGSVDIDIAEYMKLCIKAFSILKERFDPENNLEYTRACEYLGLAHWKIAAFDNVKENCTKALAYFSEALNLITPDFDPLYYARLQSATGNAYVSLADIQDRQVNCKNAIMCFNESLKYISSEETPVQYGIIHHNLGNVYNILLDPDLTEIQERPAILRLAIESNKKALKIRTFEKYPREYALSSNNMGISYMYLAESENKAENLKLSIGHFRNGLKVYDRKKDPITYSLCTANLGYVYSMLAECENSKENIKKAVEMVNEALEIRTQEKFPYQYANTIYSLGAVYFTAARAMKSIEYCNKALDALEESLIIRTYENYPLQYALSQNLIGDVYLILSALEDSSLNGKKALAAFNEALRVYTIDAYPRNYASVKESISKITK